MSTQVTDPSTVIRRRVNSSVWAAWADALGFISELTDDAGLRRRLGDRPFHVPIEWHRRVGGKFGATTKLPAGTYSDDTQLRLAVSRSIRPTGFDPEAFAKVELPVWTSYALGGGRASKAAAAHISGPSVPWFGNFFTGWTKAGGNGAAMRIQPHVWAARQTEPSIHFLMDVLTDAVITHGHPRALVGSLMHAMSLGFSLQHGHPPLAEQWTTIVDELHQFPSAIREHAELSMWCSAWERETQQSIDEAWKATLIEVADMLPAAQEFATDGSLALNLGKSSELSTHYDRLIDKLALRSPDTRGSGTSTVVAALALALVGVEDPAEVMRLTVRALGTDTDTIATMAAALLGAVTSSPPPGPIMDHEYIVAEATRLASISLGEEAENSFRYPDLLRWEPPTTQADAVGLVAESPALAGLGICSRLDEAGTSRSFAWSWATLDFGQTILVKHRAALSPLPETQHPRNRPALVVSSEGSEAAVRTPVKIDAPAERQQPTASHSSNEASVRQLIQPRPEGERSPRALDFNVDAMLEWVRAQGHTDQALGYAVRRIAELGSVEQMIGFSVTLQAEIKGRGGHTHPPKPSE